MTRNQTREQLIDVGTEIIGLHGFNTTGINAVLSRAGVPKGSFYYYFPSKEDFGLAVIDSYAAEYSRRIDGFLLDTSFSPLERILNYMTSNVENMESGACKRGCLLGNLGQELSSQNETFRARLDAVFKGWQEQFARCLEEAKAAGEIDVDADSEELAGFVLSGWEGAILRAKMMQSTAPMRTFIEIMFTQVLRPS